MFRFANPFIPHTYLSIISIIITLALEGHHDLSMWSVCI